MIATPAAQRVDQTPVSGSASIDHLVILAGGKGTRLAPITGPIQKVLAPIGGKPVLQHQLELAVTFGIKSVIIFGGYRAKDVAAFVNDGSKFGLNVRMVVETEPLGTAGAAVGALNLLPEQFFVLYGDVMAAEDLQAVATAHIAWKADFTMVVHPNDHPLDSDLVETDLTGRVTAIHACPHPPDAGYGNLVNAGLYAIRREALRPWAGKKGRRDFVKDVASDLVANGGRVLAYRSSNYLKDTGTPARLQQVESDYLSGLIHAKRADGRRPAIFIDRDGTLNVEKGYLCNPGELELLPGVGAALRSLRRAGFRIVIVTNQPVVARGEASEADLAGIHRRLEWELGKSGAFVDAIYVCLHHPDRGFPGERADLKIVCDCRKPAIGLVERASRELRIDIASSWMVGDRTSDIETARRAGMRSVLVQTGSAGGDRRFAAAPDHIAADLGAAAEAILVATAAARS
jgi:histidinol-phosphate phosphatase family protein